MIPALIIAAFLLLVAGFARAGAASLVRTPRADALHDAAEHVPGARRVAEMLEERQVIVPSINIVHSILLVGAALPAAWALTASMEGPMLLLSLVVLGFILVSFGDLIPRAIGRRSPRRLAYRLALLLSVFISVGSQAAEIMSDDDDGDQYEIGDGDAEDQGEIELITSVLEFSETIVREVMVPRTDMTSVQADASLTELLRIIDEFGFSRIPVVGDSLDDVVGMIIVKDLLPRLASGDRPAKVRNVMRSIDFVPETKRVSDLLRDMQASKSHMAVVVDEYGGTAGLVTVEDIVEEVLGSISVTPVSEEISQVSEHTWVVDGTLPVEDLGELMHRSLEDDDWNTAAGLIMAELGRLPRLGDQVDFEGHTLKVIGLRGRRITRIEVRRT